jgi:hypothetical protein
MNWKTVDKIKCSYCNSQKLEDILEQPNVSFTVKCLDCEEETKVYIESGEASIKGKKKVKIKQV